MSEKLSFTVHARWDEATRTRSTDGEDIPGLVCETETFDALLEVIHDAAPELLHNNLGIPSGQAVQVVVLTEETCIAA